LASGRGVARQLGSMLRPASIFVFLWLHWVAPCGTVRLTGTDGVSALDEDLFGERPVVGVASAVQRLAAQEDGHASALLEGADEASASEDWGPFSKQTEEEETGRFNSGVVSRMFRAMGQREGEAGCAAPLLASATVNRSQWEYIVDNSHKYFLARARKEWRSGGAFVLHSTGRLWDDLAIPVGALPVVAGFKLYAVDGRWENTWTWAKLLEKVPFKGSSPAGEADETIEPVVLSFLAGYDFRSCWGNTVDQIHEHHVCGPEPLNMLASDLEYGAVAQFDVKHKKFQVLNTAKQPLGNFTLQEMSEDELMLLRRVAPELQADGDARLETQEGMCYRSALAPICVVLVLPSVCRGETDGCHKEDDTGLEDVLWMAQRRVELPEPFTVQGMKIDDHSDKVKAVKLRGPQVSRSIQRTRHLFAAETKWQGEDQGFMTLFPMGLYIESCGSREASLALQLDTMALAGANMTGYEMEARFYKQESAKECMCQVGNRTYWPLIMDAHRPKTQQRLRLAIGVTDWLKQDTRSWYQLSSPKQKPQTYHENFMRMFPHYFRLEHRDLHKIKEDNETRTVLRESDSEPGEYMEVGTKVRALEKIKYKSGLFCSDRSGISWAEWAYNILAEDCKGVINVTNETTGQDMIAEFFLKQMPQENSWSAPSKSKYKILSGQTGEIIKILWPENGMGQPMVVVRWDHILGKQHSMLRCTVDPDHCWVPAPLFNVRPNQMMAINRTIIRMSENEAPTPEPSLREPDAADGSGQWLPVLLSAGKFVVGIILLAGVVGCLCMFNDTVEVLPRGRAHRRWTQQMQNDDMQNSTTGDTARTNVTALPQPLVMLRGANVGMQPRLGETAGPVSGELFRGGARNNAMTVADALGQLDLDEFDEFDDPQLPAGIASRLEAPEEQGQHLTPRGRNSRPSGTGGMMF